MLSPFLGATQNTYNTPCIFYIYKSIKLSVLIGKLNMKYLFFYFVWLRLTFLTELIIH